MEKEDFFSYEYYEYYLGDELILILTASSYLFIMILQSINLKDHINVNFGLYYEEMPSTISH